MTKPVPLTGPNPPMCDRCVYPAQVGCGWLYYCERCWEKHKQRETLAKESAGGVSRG